MKYSINKQVRLSPEQLAKIDIIRNAMSEAMMINVSLTDIIRIAIEKLIKEYEEE